MKRQRGRGRKPGGGPHHHNNQYQHNQPNRAMESNGPEVKVRGPAAHIHERYLQLARDATSAGDRVLGENYLQHADHYFRLLRSMQPATPAPQNDRFSSGDQEFGRDEEGEPDNEGGESEAAGREQGDQPDVEFPQGQQPQQQFDRDNSRRRGRRNRFRPGGEGEDAEAGGAEFSEQRGDRPEQRSEQRQEQRPEQQRQAQRPERGPREPDLAGPEGFSTGPKPAFLRND